MTDECYDYDEDCDEEEERYAIVIEFNIDRIVDYELEYDEKKHADMTVEELLKDEFKEMPKPKSENLTVFTYPTLYHIFRDFINNIDKVGIATERGKYTIEFVNIKKDTKLKDLPFHWINARRMYLAFIKMYSP